MLDSSKLDLQIMTLSLAQLATNPSRIWRQIFNKYQKMIFTVQHQSRECLDLHANLFYSYHIQQVQTLLPTHFPRRRLSVVPSKNWKKFPPLRLKFYPRISFSPKAIRNFHNTCFFNYENSHAIVGSEFPLNIWGIIS